MLASRFLLTAGLLLPVVTHAQRRAEPAAPQPATIDSAWYSTLKWRHVGPEGNRVTSVAGVNGDRTTYYAGAASGGLWKTSDAGNTWRPIFDD
ncbi:MAG: hypothetical protein JNL26_07745, partial [Gemmatimonadetes bacterium]|nr:hypothetical protein [Gemmatimonadota bacterium]